MTQDEKKQAVARAALEFVEVGTIVGVGTGSTANYFIDALAESKHKIDNRQLSWGAGGAKDGPRPAGITATSFAFSIEHGPRPMLNRTLFNQLLDRDLQDTRRQAR